MVDKGQLVADISLNEYILRENSYAAALIENLSESFYSFDIVYDYGRWLRPKHSTRGFRMQEHKLTNIHLSMYLRKVPVSSALINS